MMDYFVLRVTVRMRKNLRAMSADEYWAPCLKMDRDCFIKD
jgi:hypothetical protein